MKENMVSIKRVPGTGRANITARVEFEFNPDSEEAVKQFGRVLKALIPPKERAAFLDQFNAAARAAGFKASA